LVRLVVSAGGQVAVDLWGGESGRGAHLHPAVRCLALAPRGLTRSFRRPVEVTAERLGHLLESAAHRRTAKLLVSAVRSSQAEEWIDAADGRRAGKVKLLVVARDASDRASTGSVVDAIAQGDAVAWGTKAELGMLMGKSEVAVLGIVSPSLSAALRSAMAIASSVASSSGARRAALAGAVMGTEDR
jgi:predicted RNA-binding protein YlxR (DUF448 family)